MASESESPQAIEACDLHARESQRLQPDRTPEPPSTPGEGTTQPRCIVARLRAEVAWEADVGELMAEAANEIERLRLAIRRLAEQDATLSVCDGNVTVTMDATLTDAERAAIEEALAENVVDADLFRCEVAKTHAATLRGLLERTGPTKERDDKS
jgi:hypothetical protein